MTDTITAPDPADDLPARKGGLVEFCRKVSAAGVIPELTDHQLAFLEAFDGARPPLTSFDLAYASRRAGRRYLRALIAAHALLAGEDVRFTATTAEQAGAARDDAVEVLTGYCAAVDLTPPPLTLTIYDEVPLEGIHQQDEPRLSTAAAGAQVAR